jgi:hypothetical protein
MLQLGDPAVAYDGSTSTILETKDDRVSPLPAPHREQSQGLRRTPGGGTSDLPIADVEVFEAG